jgi:hypothetical protein
VNISVFKRSTSHRVYIASSFKHPFLTAVADAVSAAGHEPFQWWVGYGRPERLFPHATSTAAADYVSTLYEPAATAKFKLDKAALDECDVGVLLPPAGASAHSEAVYIRHALGKPVITFLGEGFKPDLMHRLLDNGFVATIPDLLFALTLVVPRDAAKTGDLTVAELNPFPLPSSRWA